MSFAEKFKAWIKSLGFDVSDEQLKTMPEPEVIKETTPAAPINPTASTVALPADFVAEFNGMKAQLTQASELLKKEQEARENLQKSLEEKSKAENAAKIQAIIDEAINKHGKIPANNDVEKNRWLKMFEADFEATEFALSKIPAKINTGKTDTNPNTGENKQQVVDISNLRRAAADAFTQN